VKSVIPESIFSGPRGQVDARSWDAALDVVQQSLFGMAVANDVTDEQDFVLTEVFKQCEELRSKKYLEVLPQITNLRRNTQSTPAPSPTGETRAAHLTMDNGLFLTGSHDAGTPRWAPMRSLQSN
jgi:hypothetical protein